jgi:hypothetical protein
MSLGSTLIKRSSRLLPLFQASRPTPSTPCIKPFRFYSTKDEKLLTPTTTPTVSPPPRSLAEQRHLSLPAKFKPEPHVADDFDNWRPNKDEYHIVAIVVITIVTVLAVDLYWSFYLKPKPLDRLSETEFGSYELLNIIPITPTTSLFRFKADIPEHKDIVMPSHIVLKDDSCQVGRSYTPIAYDRESFDLLIKKYDTGLVSRFVHSLKEGRMVEMRGPILSFPYERNMVEEIGMIAGGTGITPMYQLIKQILRDTEDTTRISLIYANNTEILLQREVWGCFWLMFI